MAVKVISWDADNLYTTYMGTSTTATTYYKSSIANQKIGSIPKFSIITSAIFSADQKAYYRVLLSDKIKEPETVSMRYFLIPYDLKDEDIGKEQYESTIYTTDAISINTSTYSHVSTSNIANYLFPYSGTENAALISSFFGTRLYAKFSSTVSTVKAYNCHQNKQLRIEYTPPKIKLNITIQGNGDVSGNKDLEISTAGTSVKTTLIPKPKYKYKFLKWSDGVKDKKRTFTFTEDDLNAPITTVNLTAIFVEIQPMIGLKDLQKAYVGNKQIKYIYVNKNKIYDKGGG